MSQLNILELAQGAIREQINNEISKIWANILDPNTEALAARKLTITLTFKSDENRSVLSCSAQAKATLAPVKAVMASIMIEEGRDGIPHVAEWIKNDPNQISLIE